MYKFIYTFLYDMAAELLLNKFGTISKDEIKKLLRFCTEDVSFQFGDVFYKQKNGVTMGSSLAPILAEIYYQILKTKIFSSIFLSKSFSITDMSTIYL